MARPADYTPNARKRIWVNADGPTNRMGGRLFQRLRPATLLRDEGGFTLIEVMVTATMLVVVLGAVLSVFEATNRVAAKDSERSVAINEATVGLNRMTRDLRQTYQVVGPTAGTTSNYMDVLVRITPSGTTTPQNRRVLYKCDAPSDKFTGYRECVRYESSASTGSPGSPPGGATATVVADRLQNGTSGDPVFSNLRYPTGASRPTMGEVTFKMPASGERKATGGDYTHSITLGDGFYMRNLDVAQ
jgi:type II secretory pathway pseudopilin PulG